jgi:hypothetical protein
MKPKRNASGLPENPKISNLAWSPNDKKNLFSHTTASGLSWVIDVALAKPQKPKRLSMLTSGSPFNWMNDETILVKML